QGEIKSRCNPRRGEQFSVLNPDRSRSHFHLWMALRKFLRESPVSGGATSVEKSRSGQKESCNADASNPAGAMGLGAQPCGKGGLIAMPVRKPANKQCRIEWPGNVLEQPLREKCQEAAFALDE